jgi:hypothetical protein
LIVAAKGLPARFAGSKSQPEDALVAADANGSAPSTTFAPFTWPSASIVIASTTSASPVAFAG